MARIDGYVRLVQKALPDGATPSVPLTDDHTDGTWTYRDLYDREIAINDEGTIYWRSLDSIYEFTTSTASSTDIYTISATLSGSTAIFTRNDSATYSLNLSSLETQLTNVDYIAFNTTPTVVHTEGTIHWNDTTKTLEVDTENSGVRIEVGQQLYLRVNNQTGAQLDKGKIVYINGQQGQRPTVTLASNTSEATSSKTLGFVAATMSNGQNGYVLTYGILDGINTNSYAPGTTLYLSTSGNWTSTKPVAPNHMVSVGKVINQSTTGSIYVSVQNGYEINELHDVLITGATAGQILQYNGSLWVNATASGTPTLSQVLTEGNNTNNNDIVLNTNPLSSTADNIRAFGNTLDDSKFSFEDLGSNEWAPTMRVDDADTKNYITVGKTDTYIHSSQVGGAINRYSQVKLNNGSSANVEMSSQNIANGEYSLIRTRVDGNVVLENHEGVRIEFYPQLLSTDPKNIIITAPDEFILQGGDMKIIGATGGFAGIKYNADYSTNFTNRSLVDKEYVDGVAGSGGTLQQTLTLGNTTGTHSIYISSSASKIEGYNGISQHWYNASNFLGDYFQIENGTGTSASFIRIFDDASGAINLANNNAWDLTSNDAGRTSIYMGGNTQILSENRDFAGNTFHVKTNAAIAPSGSTTETRDMINDTSAMVSTYTDGAGTQTYGLLQAYHNGGLKAGQIYVYNDRVNLRAEDNGVSFTNIALNYTDITVSGTPSFGGMKYDRNYAANFTARSLVDKAYVDGLITGTPNLQTVLATGNSSGNNDIVFTNNYGLRNSGGEGKIIMTSFGTEIEHKVTTGSNYKRGQVYASGDTGVVQITADFWNATGDTYGAGGAAGASSYARLFYQETQISTGNGYLTLVQTNRDNILVGSAYNGTLANPNFVGLEYNHNYAANFTARSLVDKAYVDAAVAGGGGGTVSSLAQVLAVGNTASTDIDMNQYQIQNVSVIDADGNVGIHTINMINSSLLTLMYNT